jgi:hypothetical protein
MRGTEEWNCFCFSERPRPGGDEKRVSWRAFIPDIEVSHHAPSLDRSQVRKIYARLSASLVWISTRANHLRRISRGAAVRIRLMREDRERAKLDLAEGRSQ